MQPRALWCLPTASVFAIALSLTCALAQPAKTYAPKVGQDGKDVVWVPTAQTLVDKMLDMAKVTAEDYVIDLGSGDGRTVITAARRGAKALGIEYNPDMVELSKTNAAKAGVGDKAVFVKGDIFESDFSQASVITLFLLPELNERLRPKLLDMKPGTRVVSNSFDMGDWQPDQEVRAPKKCSEFCQAYLWIVPAKVQGAWQLSRQLSGELPGGKLELKQKYQMVTGTLTSGKVVAAIAKGRLKGNEITFVAVGTSYRGTVGADGIEGTTRKGRTEGTWRATR